MEKQFQCSKDTLKKARTTFLFYAIGLLVLGILFSLPFLLGKQNRLVWNIVIYALLAAFFIYQGYRSFRVLRSLQHSVIQTDGVTVSGIHTEDPFQKGIPFEICVKDITGVDETVTMTKKTDDVGDHRRTLCRTPFESSTVQGYRSFRIETGNVSYTLFGIELTDEIKNVLMTESSEINRRD